MIEIQIDDKFDSNLAAILQQSAQAVLEDASAKANASVVLTGDEELQALNSQYLGIDAPTDVLSFPAGEIDPDTQELYLGDVIISLPRAEDQASLAGHSLQDELALLVVHGMLHLLGYDHVQDDEKARMWTKQADLLGQLGRGATAPVA